MGDYIKKFLNLALTLGSRNVWNRLPRNYYLRRLQRYHICNILQGVYEVLLCRRIQTDQIGSMYEPFSCRIWSFANAEQQILLISMLIFTFVLSMLLRLLY